MRYIRWISCDCSLGTLSSFCCFSGSTKTKAEQNAGVSHLQKLSVISVGTPRVSAKNIFQAVEVYQPPNIPICAWFYIPQVHRKRSGTVLVITSFERLNSVPQSVIAERFATVLNAGQCNLFLIAELLLDGCRREHVEVPLLGAQRVGV